MTSPNRTSLPIFCHIVTRHCPFSVTVTLLSHILMSIFCNRDIIKQCIIAHFLSQWHYQATCHCHYSDIKPRVTAHFLSQWQHHQVTLFRFLSVTASPSQTNYKNDPLCIGPNINSIFKVFISQYNINILIVLINHSSEITTNAHIRHVLKRY